MSTTDSHKPWPASRTGYGTGQFKCPKCGGDTGVTDSRPHAIGNIKRRRCCVACAYRFTTYEVVEGDVDPRTKAAANALRQLADKLDGETTVEHI